MKNTCDTEAQIPYTGKKTLRRARADLIRDQGNWERMVSLTFRRDVRFEVAHKLFTEYLRKIAREHECQHIRVAWAGGPQTCRREHMHALVVRLDSKPFELKCSQMQSMWKHGRSEIDPVRAQAAASAYLAKHDYWMIAVVCTRERPCRRKQRGCRYDVAPWPTPNEVLEL